MSPPIPETLETGRLSAARPRDADDGELRAMLVDDRMWPTLWGPSGPPTPAEAGANLAGQRDRWQRDGIGLWVLRDRATGAFVGRGGLQTCTVAGAAEVELAWAIVPERQGEGLATELARAAAAIGLGAAPDGLGRDSLVAMTLPGNAASRRVMEKLSMRQEPDIVHAGLTHVLYRLSR